MTFDSSAIFKSSKAFPMICPALVAFTATPEISDVVSISPVLISPLRFAANTSICPTKPTDTLLSPRFSPPRKAGCSEATPIILLLSLSHLTASPLSFRQTTEPYSIA